MQLKKSQGNEPIPMSRHALVEEFRRVYLPPIAFTASLAVVLYLWGNRFSSRIVTGENPQPPLPALTNNNWSVK